MNQLEEDFHLADITAKLITMMSKESLKPNHVKHRGLSLAQLLTYNHMVYAQSIGIGFKHSRKTGKKIKTLHRVCDELHRKCPNVMRQVLPILISPELEKLNTLGYGEVYHHPEMVLDLALWKVRQSMMEMLRVQGVDTSFTDVKATRTCYLPISLKEELKIAAPLLNFRGKQLRYFKALLM